MPTLTVGKLRAVVEVDTSQLKKAKTDVKGFGMDIKSSFKSINRSIRNTGLIATTALSLPLAMFGTASVKAASDAVEMTNVFNVAYQNIRQESETTANQLASDFDLASSTSKRLLGDVGDLMVGFGLTDKAALSLSNRTLRIAGDLTSFRNIAGGIPKVTNAIFRGMLGISQALKPLGVAMNQRSKEFRAQIKEMMVSKGVTEQVARAELVLQEVIRQSVNAVGDYDRTRGELANTTRRLGEMTKFMREEFGKILIQGLRLDVVIGLIGTGMKILAKTLSIIPGFLRPIIGGFILLAITIPPVVVGFAIFNLAVLSLQKNSLTLTSALKMQTFFLKRYFVPSLIKASFALKSFSIWATTAKFSLASFGRTLDKSRIAATFSQFKNMISKSSFFGSFIGGGMSMVAVFIKIGMAIKAAWVALLAFAGAPIVGLVAALSAAIGSVAFAFIRIKNSIPKSDLIFLENTMTRINKILNGTWTVLKAIGKTAVEIITLIFKSVDKLLTNAIFNMNPMNVFKALKEGRLGDLNLFGGQKDIFKSFHKNMQAIGMDVAKTITGAKGGAPLIPAGAGATDISKGIVTTPELAGAAIRGTSEAVKIETQRSANKKVEENTRKTAMNTEKMASVFINNQVVLMPANIAT